MTDSFPDKKASGPPASAAASALIGTSLKHYRIEEFIGQGGMGVVYRGRDTRLNRPVAIKLLSPALLANSERRNRFIQEARAAAALSHPAIAQVYDIDEDDGRIFIVMEYIDGRSVGRLITDRELDLLSAVEIALQVTEGLEKAHDAGILHRDIKSDNIMVTRDGHAKLLDFGLAKLMEPGSGDAALPADPLRTLTKDAAQTLPGLVVGTIPYMSPEQARGKDLDARSDLFSLGIVLYEMVTSELPFKGDTPLDTMHAIAYEEARPVTIVRRNLSPQVHRIVSRCLRKRPEDRYPDARALAADLKRLKLDLESGTRADLKPAERFRNWLDNLKTSFPLGKTGIWIVVAAVILAVALLFTDFNWGSLIGPAVIGLFVYRAIRNKKKRLIATFAKNISALPTIQAVIFRDDKLTVVVDKAPASVYLRITGLVEAMNGKLFFGKPVEADIQSDLSEDEIKPLIRRLGVVYVRSDLLGGPAIPVRKKKSGTHHLTP
ncbi:MAG: serine/threonine-protein kinase [Candidatus Aminicenantales bacterium]